MWFARLVVFRCFMQRRKPSRIAVGLENPYLDKGIGDITGLPQDEGVFKVPSLRNIELTAPYMHDGRFATLEEVVDFIVRAWLGIRIFPFQCVWDHLPHPVNHQHQ